MALAQITGELIHYPGLVSGLNASTSALSYLINDDTDECYFVIQIPQSGTLTQIALGTGTVTTGDANVSVRLETVDDATGRPTGTLYKANATGTWNVSASNTTSAVDINNGTGVACTVGDIVAVRVKRPGSGTLNASVMVALSVSSYSFPYCGDYNITSGTAWSATTARSIGCALNIGGWICPPHCHIRDGGSTVFGGDLFNNPKERGAGINLPFAAEVAGYWLFHGGTWPAGTTYKVILYATPTGSPTIIATTDILDTDMTGISNATRNIRGLFQSPVTLLANTLYAVVLAPQGATSINLSYLSSPNAFTAAYPGGSANTFRTRDTGGTTSFSETNTRIPMIGLFLSKLDDGAGGNGGAVGPWGLIR